MNEKIKYAFISKNQPKTSKSTAIKNKEFYKMVKNVGMCFKLGLNSICMYTFMVRNLECLQIDQSSTQIMNKIFNQIYCHITQSLSMPNKSR